VLVHSIGGYNGLMQTTKRDSRALLTCGEAAELLNVPESTLAQWRSEQRGPLYVQFEGIVRYRLADLEAYLAEHVVAPEHPAFTCILTDPRRNR
jgi:Helix-turn-helix domain